MAVAGQDSSSNNSDEKEKGSRGDSYRGGASNFERGGYAPREFKDRGERDGEKARLGPMEVSVEHNIEKAMRILKRKLIKEGLFKELKARRYYEKPSERKKRKVKESKKKVRKEEARAKKNQMFVG